MGPDEAVGQAERLKNDGNEYYFRKDRIGAAIDAYTGGDWGRVEEDCWKAIQLDHDSVKGHYILGLALLQKKEYSKGVKELEKAMDFGRGAHPRSYMVEEIWQELSKTKFLEWKHDSTNRSWELRNLKETYELALREKFSRENSESEGFLDDIHDHSENLEALGCVFLKAEEADIPTAVPDYLCCKITLDIFIDPVITPSGLTFERAVLLEHLNKAID